MGKNDTVCVIAEEAALICKDNSVDATRKCPGTSGMVCCTLMDHVLAARSGHLDTSNTTMDLGKEDLQN